MNTLKSIHTNEVARYMSGNTPSLLFRLKNKEVSKEELIQIVQIRYQAAHFFEDWLRLIITVVSNSSLSPSEKQTLSHAAKQNLREELGEVEIYGGPHRDGRIVQLEALGINPDTWAKELGTYNKLGDVHPAAKHLIESLRVIANRGPVEAITALWYYENRISLDGVNGDYCLLLHALESKFPELYKEEYVEGDALYHIASHAKHDEYHAKLAEDALEASGSATEHVITEVCDSVRIAVDRFWNEVL